MTNLKPLTSAITLVTIGMTISWLPNADAHVNPADHAINTATCSGVLYRSNHWSIANTSRLSNQSAAVCNSPTPEDNCGQFDLAVNYGDNFCASQTQPMSNALLSSHTNAYFYAPQNLVTPGERTTYLLSQDVDFSCNVCADTEQIYFENGDGNPRESFVSGEPVFFHWRTSSAYPSNSPYSQYIIQAKSRPLGASSSFQPFATIADNNQSFGLINLVDALYHYQNQQLQFTACAEYEITLAVKANNDNQFFYSKHYFKLYHQANCPETASSINPGPTVSS